jgi:hypothetical protein
VGAGIVIGDLHHTRETRDAARNNQRAHALVKCRSSL